MPIATSADLVGRVLAGRYRLAAPIGVGASGQVYQADDVQLKRKVAVKVLHAALAEDQGFLKRFRSEAQLAASLHHPNIMAVYDWGEDTVPFMVTEILMGGSMRAMLDAGNFLTPAQAAHIGTQILSALEYAHARGLVHRDIKPANLLFDEHGTVRVADFGLARALAEASWTEPAGSVVGTARYAAPEQAAGAQPDPRADLYAVALVLSEAVTGEVPLTGDTMVGTLGMRNQHNISAADELDLLGPVVERAGTSNPDDRYPDAATMKSATQDVAHALPKPAPLVLVGTKQGESDPHPTQISRTEAFDQDDIKIIRPAQIEPSPRQFRARRAQRRVGMIVGGAIVAAVFFAGWLAIGRGTGALIPSPNLVGLTQADATRLADDAGFDISIDKQFSDDPRGTVVDQTPSPGGWGRRGEAIKLVISDGPKPVVVPDIAAQQLAAAQALLEETGFVVEIKREFNEEIPKDIALRTNPEAGKKFAPDDTISLIVSDGPAPIAIPDVRDKSVEEATTALRGKSFKVATKEEFSDDIETGKVVRTEPNSGDSAAKGSTVTLVVSKGPELVDVPNVVGKTVELAAAQLEAVGLVADVQNFSPGRTVRAQAPGSGQVRKGTKVTLFL